MWRRAAALCRCAVRHKKYMAELNETALASLVGLLSNGSALEDALEDSPIGGTPIAAVATTVSRSPPLAFLLLIVLCPSLLSMGPTLLFVFLAPLQLLCLPCALIYARRRDAKLLDKTERSSEDPRYVTIELLPASASHLRDSCTIGVL